MADSQDLVCTGCQKTLRIPAKFWGKKVRCPGCRQVLSVPAGVTSAAPATPRKASLPKAAAGVQRSSPSVARVPPPPPVDALDDVDFIDDADDPYAEDPYGDLPDQYEFDLPPRPKARPKPKKRKKKPKASKTESSGGSFRMERGMLGAGVLGGMGLMALAVIWFVAGLAGGIIFYYPPVLFIIGFVAMIKGFVGSD